MRFPNFFSNSSSLSSATTTYIKSTVHFVKNKNNNNGGETYASECRRRRTELLQDVKELIHVVLPLCRSHPSVYDHFSDTLNDWTKQIEKIDEEDVDDDELTTISTEDSCCGSIITNNDDNNNNNNDDDDDSLVINNENSDHDEKKYSSKSSDEKKASNNTYTLDAIQQDIIFLKQMLGDKKNNNNVSIVITRRGVRQCIHNLIKQLKSDIHVYHKIQRKKKKQYKNQWKEECRLLVFVLNKLEDDETNNHIYNQVLTHYQSRAGGSNRSWKRPQRPTSELRWKDVQILDDLIDIIAYLTENNKIDDNSKVVASQRVREVLFNLRENCRKEAKTMTSIEYSS